jgi:hypothetical protein
MLLPAWLNTIPTPTVKEPLRDKFEQFQDSCRIVLNAHFVGSIWKAKIEVDAEEAAGANHDLESLD